MGRPRGSKNKKSSSGGPKRGTSAKSSRGASGRGSGSDDTIKLPMSIPKKRPAPPVAEGPFDFEDIPCKYGSMNYSGLSEAIGITVEHNRLDYVEAAPKIVASRLAVRLKVDPDAERDTPGQAKFIDAEATLDGIADVSSLAIAKNVIRFRASFKGEMDLRPFAGKSGTISMRRIGDAEDPAGPVGGDIEDGNADEAGDQG